jgi:predicted transcriptional regulator
MDKEAQEGKSDVKTTGLDVVEAFALYFVLLLRMDWKHSAEIQMKRLIEKYFGKVRSETFKAVNRYLLILKMAGLIDYNGDQYTGSDVICANVVAAEKNFSLIACVNENLIRSAETKKSNALFAVHCLLNIKRIDKNNEWEPVEISQDKLAYYLMIHKAVVRYSLNWLLKNGFIRRPPQQYYTDSSGKAKSLCLTYTVHDYDNPVDNTKLVEGIEKQKAAKQRHKTMKTELKELLRDFSQTPILLIGEEYSKALKEIRDDPSDNNKKIRVKVFNFLEIEKEIEAKNLMDHYNNMDDNGMFLIIDLSFFSSSRRLQEMFLKFIEDNRQLPILLIVKHDDITAPFLSRINKHLKKPIRKVHGLNFKPVHKGYLGYEKKYSYYRKASLIVYALDNCPELFPPTLTNTEESTALYRLDKLISKLTGGKTYLDVLRSEPDVTAEIPIETKYLSLALKRSDLARLTLGEYEAEIQNNT